MSIITLAQSEAIIDAIFERGRSLDLRPLSVVVVEPGCKVKAFKKEDGSAMMRFEMAFGKAYASLALGRSSGLVRERAEQRPMFMDFMLKASDDQIFCEGGGMLVRDADGELIGAIGVTGDTQEQDEELAAHGIRTAGLKTDEDCADLGSRVRLTRD
ncbi:MAG: heme-binding protein [Alphaproteobacteria bacterium]